MSKELLFCPICGLQDENKQSVQTLWDNGLVFNCSGCHSRIGVRLSVIRGKDQ